MITMSENLTNSKSAAPPPPPPPRPAAAPPPPPPTAPSRPAQGPAKKSRRKFLTLFAVVGGLLALAPWVPFGNFLSSSAAGEAAAPSTQTIVLDQNTEENGSASGKMVNVKDLTAFPPNSTWVMTYPSSGNPSTDGQNPNTFVKFALIRLPTELGGGNRMRALRGVQQGLRSPLVQS